MKGKLDIVRRLLEMKANTDIPNTFGLTPLMCAVRSDDQKMVRLLLQSKANIDQVTEFTMLCGALCRFKLNAVECAKTPAMRKLLIDKGAKPLTVNQSNESDPLIIMPLLKIITTMIFILFILSTSFKNDVV